jgi:hypothetical protein
MRDDLVRSHWVKNAATMLLIREGIRQPRAPSAPWRQPIPLSFDEMVALGTLRLLISSGRLDRWFPPEGSPA